ncbi:gamma-glutamylcyclotransferase family protein [Segetibacter koreensis]|uniref:gamma-glutamylcyclotransferase family protein n=1 Tax=Segetibacter koreensis TaxID=398037 RepID=UPI000364A005|nr:gamma-glutamylcyclotransferase family protein [Segetibacter koreensis]
MENKITNLFVYGTLRSGFHNSAYAYITKHFTLIGEAKVKGVLYNAGDYPAAMPTTEENFIKGELYTAKSTDDFLWAIEQLDTYEGVDAEEGEPALYKRELTEVFYNNTSTKAWIYWYNQNLDGLIVIPSGDFMDSLELESKS